MNRRQKKRKLMAARHHERQTKGKATEEKFDPLFGRVSRPVRTHRDEIPLTTPGTSDHSFAGEVSRASRLFFRKGKAQ